MSYIIPVKADRANLTSESFTSPPLDWSKTYTLEGTFSPTVENEPLEREMEYYLRRGNRYFFRDGGAKLIIDTPDIELMKQVKRGMKCKVKYKL